ncbi:MAG: hypothetical protein NUV74_15975 [Candidatus Brocadiaceae bacterium]|nr:hypothetical protein [Candidatus Brocadiaceae bacterium]
MAPLSILPGRIRFESRYLVGKPHICRYLQERILSYLKGLTEVTVNHRTGRILVGFDENQIDKQTLTRHINHIIKEGEEKATGGWLLSAEKKNSKIFLPSATKHALMDVVAHAILPKPLNVLVPIAVKAMMTGRNLLPALQG